VSVATTVIHNADESRYELTDGDRTIGVAHYRLHEADDGTVAEFHHTFVDPAERGTGHAARLVAAALDDVRERGWRVQPRCWYVAGFIRDHAEYSNLTT
jgi:predicted GNAT family acetyltransferase